MRKKYLDAAEVINRAYDVPSTYDFGTKYAFFFVYDDDITAILRSVYIYKFMKAMNPKMKLVVVGGEGLLAFAFKVMRFAFKARLNFYGARLLKKETEAQRLKRVAMELGVPEEDIIVSDDGHNTTENLRAMSKIANGEKSLVVSTQRLAMIFKQSVDFQCNTHPEEFGCQRFNYDLCVIKQTVLETMRWYNLQVAGKRRVAMHLFASLVRRFEVYNGKFLTKPFEPDDEVKKADALLRNKFLIKQRHTGWKLFRAYLQYIPIVWDLFWHAEQYLISEKGAIDRVLLKDTFTEGDFYGGKGLDLLPPDILKEN